MAAERVPIAKMEDRKARLTERSKLVDELMKLFEELKADLQKNNSAKTLRVLKATYNNDIIDVTIDQELAEPGDYQFEVDSLAKKSALFTTGFEDPDESYVGVGYVQYDLPNGETRQIYVDAEHASLRGVASIINHDPSCGMRATVINDGSGDDNPWRILIALKKTGDDNEANFPYFYFVDGDDDLEIDQEQEATDAVVKLESFEIEIPENKTSELIPGLTIDLKKAVPDQEITIKITEDREAIVGKLTGIVEKINKILKFILTQNQLDAKSDTSRTLGGDVTLQTVEMRLRSLLFEPLMVLDEDEYGEIEVGERKMGDLGITFQRDGLLAFDQNRFSTFLSKNLKQIFHMLVGFRDEDGGKVDGFINKFEKFTQSALQKPDGTLVLRKGGIQSVIGQLDKQIENRERMLEKKESMLKDKFSRLEGTISKLKAQGAGLGSMQNQSEMFPNLGEQQQ